MCEQCQHLAADLATLKTEVAMLRTAVTDLTRREALRAECEERARRDCELANQIGVTWKNATFPPTVAGSIRMNPAPAAAGVGSGQGSSPTGTHSRGATPVLGCRGRLWRGVQRLFVAGSR